MEQSKGDRTREHIVCCAAELFLKNGYAATGLSAVLEAANVPRGSFYYAFAGKQALGAAVAEYFKSTYGDWFREVLARSDSWDSYVETLIADIREKMAQGEFYGCPFSCFGTEAAPQDEKIADVCTAAMNDFCKTFGAALARTLSEDEARRRAPDALSMYEGYLVYYRISSSPRAMELLRDGLKKIGDAQG